MELLGFSFVLDDNDGLVIRSRLNLEGPGFHILLDNGVIELPADESLGIEDSVDGVLSNLVFGSISNESFSLSECDIGWGGSVSLIVGDDLNSLILPDADAGVGGTQINTNGFTN